MNQDRLQPAYVLHSRRFRETSLIVDCLTPEHGRVVLLAKGASKGKSPTQRLLQPFLPLLMAWRGRGEMPTLTCVEGIGTPIQPQGLKLYCGFYVNELILKLTEQHDPQPELFAAYVLCVTELSQPGGQSSDIESILRRFEISLLQSLGLGLLLDADRQGRPIGPANWYTYDIAHGPTPSTEHEDHSILGATLLGLPSGQLSDARQRLQARQLMRRVLNHHLEGRPLKSRELLRSTRHRMP